MPKRATVLRSIALVGCVSFFATGARAESAGPATTAAATAPEVMIIVETPPAAGVVAAPPPAHVESRVAPKRGEPEEWYGYQTLIMDGAAIGLVMGGAAIASRSGSGDSGGMVALAGGATYLLGAPIVHWMHGAIGPGFGSLGLRVGLPLSGLFWGALLGSTLENRHNDGAGTGAAIGFLGGMAGAVLIDAALLAYEKPSEKEKEAYVAAKAKHPIRWLPALSPQRAGATVGVSGVFF